MSRARFYFKGATLDNFILVDKYSGFSFTWEDVITDGYILTGNETNIATVNSKYWFKIKPVSGFDFDDCHKTNSGGTSNSGNFTIDTDGTLTIYPWVTGTATIVNNYVYLSVKESAETRYSITTDLTNVVSDIPIDVLANETFTFNITANDGYKIDNVTCNIGTVTIADNKLTAIVTGTATEDITITATASVLTTVSITGTFENCTCNFTDGEIITDEKPTIIITANDGYEFDGVFTFRRGAITSSFSLSDDKLTLSATIDTDYNYILNDEYRAVKKVERIGDFTRLYNPTENELTQLAKARFQNDIDMGQYITALFKIPFAIPTDLITDEKRNIVLGTLDSDVLANGLTTYNMVVNIGEITTPEKYQNVYDYIDTECVLNLPFFDKIYLSNEFVIGQTLRIEYIIDLYSGNATCNIYSSFTGGIVESTNGVISCNIPFVQKINNNVVGLISNINKNVIDTAYIEVIRNKPYNVETVFGNETIDFGVIGDYNGFIKISDVVLNSSATNEEKNEIIDLLKEGITINE